ncbi:MAG: hypothetical protein NC411_00605 [Bacteroides sp.]|nr:hypothetical protein [Bacteroides sp.]
MATLRVGLLIETYSETPSEITDELKKTIPFVTTSGDYLSVLLSLWLPRYGWLVILPIAAFAACGVMFDVRFLLVALMLLFIVVPMLMSFLYTYYMLAPEARRAVIRKEVEISEGEFLKLTYLGPEEKDEAAQRNSKRMLLPIAEEKDDDPLPPLPVPAPEKIGWDDVIATRSTSRFMVYIIKGPRLNFILIPHSAFMRKIQVQ